LELFFTGIKLKIITIVFLISGIFSIGCLKPTPPNPPAPKDPIAKVSFVFHDGLASTYTNVAPLFAKYGYAGTAHILTGCIGMTTKPNKCSASYDRVYMSFDQVMAMQRVYGWEIGSHTVSHPLLSSTESGYQDQKLSIDEVKKELEGSKSFLSSLNFKVESLATPYGDYDWKVLAEIAKLYSTHQGFWDIGYNKFPFNGVLIRNHQVQGGVSVDTVKSYIDQAIINKEWITLTFHEVKTGASQIGNAYEYETSDLDKILSYVKSKNLLVVTMTDGLKPYNTNLITNGSFTSGISSEWKNSDSKFIKADSNNNGFFPDRKNSARFSSTNKEIYLSTPKVNVSPTDSYLVKTSLDIKSYSQGELFFYMDEYDSKGKLISGKFLKGLNSIRSQILEITFIPSSIQVKSVSLKIGLRANSGITGFIDNISLEKLDKNLLRNSGFDLGLADGWTTRNTNPAVFDTENNGSFPGPKNSIKLSAGPGADTFLFSPQVPVAFGTNYLVRGFVNVSTLSSGELYIYMDEFDVNGTWIAGKYIRGIRSVYVGNIDFIYTPSSPNVKKAAIYFGVNADSGINSFVDNVEFYAR
jgi:peptidoglycan/xylan/chitin deacetylase (PgdA/CDA1 family)